MKKIIAILALLPALCLGAANDIRVSQTNSDNTGLAPTRLVAPPSGGANGIMGLNGATILPVHWTIGQGLNISGGALVALPQAWADITGKPSFSAVATAGTYASLTGIPSTFAPSAHTHAASDITSGTLATARIPALAISQTTGLQTALDSKFNTPAGTTAQYVRGDGSLATLPVAKRIETYSGTTNASGQIVVTYSTAFPAVPVVQPPAPAAANQVWTTVSSTTTGFTLQLNQRNVVTLLSIEVLLGATVPVVGTTATMLVVSQ